MSQKSYKVCYVLTDDNGNYYTDLNLLSIMSLKISNPNVAVILLCDKQTEISLKKKKHEILLHIDDLISVNTPDGSKGFRNRFIKTTMRSYITGSFLYLDADTIVRGDLSHIFSTSACFAAVTNHNGSGASDEIADSELIRFHHMNWKIPKDYVNGGVLFFSDHPEIYSFFKLWHQKWLDFSALSGMHFDQQSLNCALNDIGLDFVRLDQRYNAQVHARPQTAWGAIVWHIYTSDHHATPSTIIDLALEKMGRNRSNTAQIANAINKLEHPWIIDNLFDRFAINCMRRQKKILRPKDWKSLWLVDDYKGALMSIIGDIWKSRIRLVTSEKT